MFFDCTGLLAGLVATVITKWKSNEKYTYGYVRAETLAGFINGLFLLFISFFILSEASPLAWYRYNTGGVRLPLHVQPSQAIL